MPEIFQPEQAKISSVEKKAAVIDKETKKKTNEQLESELLAKHDVFFKQVDSTDKTFKEADKLKTEEAKKAMGKDKQEIKDLLLKAAQSGEDILAKKEENPNLSTIQQSADRISKLTGTVSENLAFFQDMDKADESLKLAKDSLKAIETYAPSPGQAMPEHAVGWQKRYKSELQNGLANLGEFGAGGYLAKYPSISSPEMKAVYDKIKKGADGAMEHLTDSRMRFLDNYGDKFNTEFDDKGNEKPLSEEQKKVINKLKEVRNGGSGGPQGESYDGYSMMMSLMSSGKMQLESAKTATDNKQRQAFLDTAKENFTDAKHDAYIVGFELSGIDAQNLPDDFAAIYYTMNGNSASVLKEAGDELDKLEKGNSLVDSKDVVDSSEKEYSEGDDSPKKAYETALKIRDGVMDAKEFDLHSPLLGPTVEKALTKLCALKGKLTQVDRATLPREYQARFDALSSTVDANVQELAQVQMVIKNNKLTETINSKNEFNKDGKEYFKMVKKEINGQSVVVVEQTEEFKKLPPEQQKIFLSQYAAVPAEVTLDLTRKMDMKEDKDWNEGLAKFENGDWQGAKKQLLNYCNKFSSNADKSVQVSSATSLLQAIVKIEFQQAKENFQTMADVQSDRGEINGVTREDLGVSVLMGWKKIDAAEGVINSKKCPLTIEEVWSQVGRAGGKDLVVDGISFMDPRVQQRMLAEPDPEKRRANILQLAKAAQDAGMTPFAKKYYEMYFSEQISEKKKTISRDDVVKAFDSKPDSQEQVRAGIKAAHEQAKTKFITERNRRLGLNGYVALNPNDPVILEENKILAKWEADYSANSGDIEQRVRNGIIDDLWTKEAKKAVHKDMMSVPDNVNLNGSKEWKEAYSGHFGVAENISGSSLVFTSDDIRNTAAEIAVGILYLEIAAAAGAITGGMASAAILGGAAEVGAGTLFASEATGFLVEGAVMHSVSVGLNEGAAGFKDTGKFMKGLVTTYATLGIMKGTGSVLGKIGSKGGQAVVEGGSEFVTPFTKGLGETAAGFGKGALKFTGKAVLDSTLMTGISWGSEKILNGKSMSSDALLRAFGDNMVTFMVMGGVHKAVDVGAEGQGPGIKDTKEAKELRDSITRSLEAENNAEKAREIADEARRSSNPDAPKLEKKATQLEHEARDAEAVAKKAIEAERATRLNEMQTKIDAMKKDLEKKDISPEEKKRIEFMVEQFEKIKTDGGALGTSEKALFEEHRTVEVPDPENPGKTKKIDLFENFNSKNFAYSKEMVELMNNYDKLLKEGPKIIKHGGDEIVILHAGPDGKVQMFFGDIGNMGPTNEFALRLKGNNANMVDLYLHDFAEVVKARFKPGQAVDGQALLTEIKTELSKKYFGIESEADFNTMKAQWNLDGTWEDYQRNMGNARILAGFRSSARGLQKEFAEQVGDRPADAARDNKEFADFIQKKIDGLDTGTPPLTEILKKNLSALNKSGALKDLFPDLPEGGGNLNETTLSDILSKPQRTAEDNMLLYFALQRVNAGGISSLEGMDATGVEGARERFGKIKQPASDATLMDFQMAGIDVPKFENRDFNTTDMKFFLDKVLEDGLHEAKKNKEKLNIYQAENPFDQNGELRTDVAGSKENHDAYEKSKNDKKGDIIAQTQKDIHAAEQKLDEISQEVQKILEKKPLNSADTKHLTDLQKQYDALIKKVEADKYKDAETGADRPGKYAENMDFWMRDRNGKPIEKPYQMYREFVIDLHNTGAINGQKGYATTDSAMKLIANFMMTKFPGASSIIRTGGGSFKLVFMDSRQIPMHEGKPISVEAQQSMIKSVLPELNAEVQKIVEADTKTVVDGNVRDATEYFRTRGGKPAAVGEVSLVSSSAVDHEEFASRAKQVGPPRTLFSIFEQRGVEPVPPDESSTLPMAPGESTTLSKAPKVENLPKVGDTVHLLAFDGAVDTFVIESIDKDTGKVRLKEPNSDIFRTVESVKALQGEILRTKIETDRASVPKEDLIRADIASGKLKLDLKNPEQAEALQKKMAPEDFSVLEANQGASPEVIASIVRGGVELTQSSVNEKGETVTRALRTYGGKELGQGMYGVVSEVAYVEKGSTELKYGVMKLPHAGEVAKANFAHEGDAAGQVQTLEAQYHDKGANHLIKPVFVSDKAIIYEKAADENGKTVNLEKGVKDMSEGVWLRQFAGGVEGLSYMQRHGISHDDFKPGNIVIGAEGGVLIDIGSKVSQQDIASGKVQVLRTQNGSMLAHYVTSDGAGGFKTDWVGQDPAYNNAHLLSESIQTGKPMDIGDKFAVGQSLRFFLGQKGYLDATGRIRSDAPAHAQQLQAIADRLMAAQQHPYQYINNNPAQGSDPYYVPLEAVDGWIRTISSQLP